LSCFSYSPLQHLISSKLQHVLAAVCEHCQQLVLQIIAYIREEVKKNNIAEQTIIGLIWSSVMSSVEWNKKEELVTEQAIKHLKVTTPLDGCDVPFSLQKL